MRILLVTIAASVALVGCGSPAADDSGTTNNNNAGGCPSGTTLQTIITKTGVVEQCA